MKDSNEAFRISFRHAARFIVAMLQICIVLYVLDNIKERNTEIIVATLGLVYSGIFHSQEILILTLRELYKQLSSRGSYEKSIESTEESAENYQFIDAVKYIAVDILCIIRLFSSLSGHGWETFIGPARRFFQIG